MQGGTLVAVHLGYVLVHGKLQYVLKSLKAPQNRKVMVVTIFIGSTVGQGGDGKSVVSSITHQ